MTQQEAQGLLEVTRQLEAANVNGGGRMGGEANASLVLLEQLELKLAQNSQRRGVSTRTQTIEPVSEAYQDAVAEYYRQLSRD